MLVGGKGVTVSQVWLGLLRYYSDMVQRGSRGGGKGLLNYLCTMLTSDEGEGSVESQTVNYSMEL